MGKRVIKSKDLAEAMDVSTETVRQWAREGKLPPPIPGFRQLRWRWQDVKHLVGEERFEDESKS